MTRSWPARQASVTSNRHVGHGSMPPARLVTQRFTQAARQNSDDSTMVSCTLCEVMAVCTARSQTKEESRGCHGSAPEVQVVQGPGLLLGQDGHNDAVGPHHHLSQGLSDEGVQPQAHALGCEAAAKGLAKVQAEVHQGRLPAQHGPRQHLSFRAHQRQLSAPCALCLRPDRTLPLRLACCALQLPHPRAASAQPSEQRASNACMPRKHSSATLTHLTAVLDSRPSRHAASSLHRWLPCACINCGTLTPVHRGR